VGISLTTGVAKIPVLLEHILNEGEKIRGRSFNGAGGNQHRNRTGKKRREVSQAFYDDWGRTGE